MEAGDIGHLGLSVQIIVEGQDPENAIIQFQKMEEKIVVVMMMRLRYVAQTQWLLQVLRWLILVTGILM